MKSTVLLDEAISIQSQRAAEHGYGDEGERSAAHVARIFNAITGRNLKERDIWILMMALKLARNEAAPGREDTLIDLASYSSLLGECDIAAELKRMEDAEKENQENTDRSQLQSLGDKLAADLSDSWMDWKGGNDPVEHWVKVDVKFRDGTMNENVSAGGLRWGNDGYLDDVIAFRVCPPVPKPLTAAAYQAQQDDGWKEWDGKHSGGPISIAIAGFFDIKTRQGVQLNRVRRGDIYWAWNPLQHNPNDVVAWRRAK